MGFEEGEMEHRGVKVLVCLAAVLVLGFSAWADSIVVGTSTGTGFIVSSDGYILTNEHVVEKATEVKVTIGTREYTATVVATLPGSDLALLKVDARGLPAVHLGNSDHMDIGDEVYALGCPEAVCGTVTAGRIANTGVNVSTDGGRILRGSLLVDITTAPGSSGGPLVNTRGEVIGIHTAGTAAGFRASIPINQAIPLLQRIPGFSTAQMGRRTQELTFREIRALVGPSTSFVVAPVLIPLAALVPSGIPGYRLSISDVVVFEPAPPPPADPVPSLHPMLWLESWGRLDTPRIRLGNPVGGRGFVARYAGESPNLRVSTNRGQFWIRILAVQLDDQAAAESAAHHAIRHDMASHTPPPYRGGGVPVWTLGGYAPSALSVLISGEASKGLLAIGTTQVPYHVGWRITHGERPTDRHGIGAGDCWSEAHLRGTTALSLGRFAFVVCLEWHEQQPRPCLSLDPDRYAYTGGCFTDRPSRDARPSAVICLPEFMAEFERVFLIAVRALLDGLPKG